jgi:hypothetical protein
MDIKEARKGITKVFLKRGATYNDLDRESA